MSAVERRRRDVVPAQPAQAAPGEPAGVVPRVTQIRLVGPPAAVDAACAALAGTPGAMWQASARKTSRHNAGDVVQYGSLIVAARA